MVKRTRLYMTILGYTKYYDVFDYEISTQTYTYSPVFMIIELFGLLAKVGICFQMISDTN